MKYLDKLLKILKTDRNTFLTYILTIITTYIVIDRFVELLFICFTGMSVSYWGPIQYTLALACPVFAFLFSGSSAYAKSDVKKLDLFYTYVIALYIIALSMFDQWLNFIQWLLLTSLPNYVEFISNFHYLVQPAFRTTAFYLPLMTAYPLFKWLYMKINDTKDIRDSIADYGGIDLSDKTIGWGPYTCEMTLGTDKETAKIVKMPENRRFESLLVVGVSGSGKTSMIFEPMIAKDLEKKKFFRDISKEMGFTALKTGIANLAYPYDNNYLNKNFNLNMLQPTSGKEKIYKAYMSKMILNDSSNITYKNIGLTYLAPDFESTSHILEVAKNLDIPVNLIDPAYPDSPGLNPFIYDDPSATAVAISSVLKGMYTSTHTDVEEAFRENVTMQAVENLSILLKEMYPRLNDGLLPTLEDLLELLTDFTLVEKMCKELEEIPELSEKYKLQLNYFKKNFYNNGSGKADTEKYVYSASTQLDNLLRISSVRNILCNRVNNIDYDKALANGEITLVCTRRGDLGATAHKAFGLFFLLIMQYSVLKRPGNERTRIPHFLYIDEFADFICPSTDSIFTLYRKYRIGTIISAQNLGQLGDEKSTKRQTILANCASKIVFGNNTPADNEWWSLELGEKREWKYSNSYDTAKGEYDKKLGGISYAYKLNYQPGKIQALKFKNCMYKVKDIKGKSIVGTMKVDFLASKYKEKQPSKNYDFTKFTNGIVNDSIESKHKKSKFNPNEITFDTNDGEIDPIQMNTTDSKYLFDNEDAIIFDFKKNK